jgi:hypothetical protein
MAAKRGRKSAASLEITQHTELTRTPRISPPEWIGAQAAEEFYDLVNSLDAAHFRPSDAPLLARYCQTILAANAAEDIGEFIALVRLQASLAKSLRLCPSSRGHHRTTARQAGATGLKKPWDIEQ